MMVSLWLFLFLTLGAQDAAVPPNEDFVEAAKLVRQAADRGSVRAQHRLGELYLSGQGVKKDEKEALKWFKKAADKGDAASQISLGQMYLKAEVKTALSWFRKAADQGSALAQFTLGSIYEGRVNVLRNRSEAVVWYSKALQQGHEDARTPLEALRKQGVITSDEASVLLVSKMVVIDAPLAKAARIKDDVLVEITVDSAGVLKGYKLIYGHPLLGKSATDAVRTLRYKPYLVNGQPTEFVTTITIKYDY